MLSKIMYIIGMVIGILGVFGMLVVNIAYMFQVEPTLMSRLPAACVVLAFCILMIQEKISKA